MTVWKAAGLAALIPGITFMPQAWAHPGHPHSPEPLARLAHSVTEWGPLLVVLVVVVVAGYSLWKSNRH
ncbi:MAG: hypothetical protein PVI91_09635 [Gammaproteobacteria bacterium]|jgi:hypothetical protein